MSRKQSLRLILYLTQATIGVSLFWGMMEDGMNDALIYIMVGALILGGVFFAAVDLMRTDHERKIAQAVAAATGLGIGAICMALFFGYGMFAFLVSAETAARAVYLGF